MPTLPSSSYASPNLCTGVIAAPVIESVVRTGTITANIAFSASSEQNADRFELNYYISTGFANRSTDILVIDSESSSTT